MHDRRARGLLASTVVAALVLAFLLALGVAPGLAAGPAWTDYGGTPIYSWVSAHRAYYPSVLYSPTNFDDHGLSYPYKMF